MNIQPTSAAGNTINSLLPKNVRDLAGKRFGSLKVVSYERTEVLNSGNKVSLWNVQCAHCDNRFQLIQPGVVKYPLANKCRRCK